VPGARAAGLCAALARVETDADIAALLPLLQAIWREVFYPVIGEAQTEYMLLHYQSPECIRREIAGGAQYFTVLLGKKPVGYLAYEIREEHLFVSKLYLAAPARGIGLSSQLFALLEKAARQGGRSRLHLHVNRGNEKAIAVYRHKGFQVVGTAVADIGGGFAMDDYYMEKELPR
jgi:GNAT superfamily N-acetyltransferase